MNATTNATRTQAPIPDFSRAEREELRLIYQYWRSVGVALNTKLVTTLSKAEMDEGGRRLGILRRGVLVFDSEDDIAYLMDYCIHHVRTNGRNAVERELIARSDTPESDELTLLRSLLHASYRVIIVESADRGLGIHVRDLRTGESFFVTDLGLGNTARPRLVLTTRIISVAGIWMTGGAGIPMGVLPDGSAAAPILAMIQKYMDAGSVEFDPAPLIRECLAAGNHTHIRHEDASHAKTSTTRIATLERADKVGRNDPCPCGSGKKFKHCCLVGR